MVRRSGQTYSEDLRVRVLAAKDSGRRIHEVAPSLEVNVSCIYRALARQRLTGIAAALPKSRLPGRTLDCHLDALIAHVAEHADTRLVEWSKAERGVRVGIATLSATLAALDVRLKRRPVTPSSRNARILRLPHRAGPCKLSNRLIFVGEIGATRIRRDDRHEASQWPPARGKASCHRRAPRPSTHAKDSSLHALLLTVRSMAIFFPHQFPPTVAWKRNPAISPFAITL